jgi:hypothetical protein
VKENEMVNKTLGIESRRDIKEELQEFISRFSF